jgi:hypothetical protein
MLSKSKEVFPIDIETFDVGSAQLGYHTFHFSILNYPIFEEQQ